MIAHILDTAASASGPHDPKLLSLLENDDMAQVTELGWDQRRPPGRGRLVVC